MKLKRLLGLCALVLCCAFLLSTTVFADIGPKPSVDLTIRGAEGRVCYVALFSKTDSTGPYSGNHEPVPVPDKTDLEAYAFAMLQNRACEDGYYFLNNAARLTDGHFHWGYMPPHDFKVVLFFPEEDRFLISEPLSRYAFDSYFTVDVTDSGLQVTESYDYTWQIISFLVRAAATIAIELLCAMAFGYRSRKALRLIFWVNLFTQGLLNLFVNWVAYSSGLLVLVLLFIPAELLVIVIEAVIYAVALPRRAEGQPKRGKAVGYAIVANIASCVVGLVLAAMLPGLM